MEKGTCGYINICVNIYIICIFTHSEFWYIYISTYFFVHPNFFVFFVSNLFQYALAAHDQFPATGNIMAGQPTAPPERNPHQKRVLFKGL